MKSVWDVSGLPGDLMEIGAYCGKSTVAIATVLSLGCSGMLHSVDPHSDNISMYGVDSLAEWTKNITEHNLNEYIVPHRLYSSELWIDWKEPLKYLFIDANHTYEACKSDFEMFSPFLVTKGLVLFHDSFMEGPAQVISEVDLWYWKRITQVDSITIFERR